MRQGEGAGVKPRPTELSQAEPGGRAQGEARRGGVSPTQACRRPGPAEMEGAAWRGRARRGCRARLPPAELSPAQPLKARQGEAGRGGVAGQDRAQPSAARPSRAQPCATDGTARRTMFFRLPRSLIGRHCFKNCQQNANLNKLLASPKSRTNSPSNRVARLGSRVLATNEK